MFFDFPPLFHVTSRYNNINLFWFHNSTRIFLAYNAKRFLVQTLTKEFQSQHLYKIFKLWQIVLIFKHRKCGFASQIVMQKQHSFKNSRREFWFKYKYYTDKIKMSYLIYFKIITKNSDFFLKLNQSQNQAIKAFLLHK